MDENSINNSENESENTASENDFDNNSENNTNKKEDFLVSFINKHKDLSITIIALIIALAFSVQGELAKEKEKHIIIEYKKSDESSEYVYEEEIETTPTETNLTTNITSSVTLKEKKSESTKQNTTAKSVTTQKTISPKTTTTNTLTEKQIVEEKTDVVDEIVVSDPEINTQTTTQAAVEFPIDINLVTYDQLLQINGVGEVTANSIINFRENYGIITDMDTLIEISGIGEAKLNLLKEYLYVDEHDRMTTTTEPYEIPEIYVTTIPTTTTTIMTTTTTPTETLPPITTTTEEPPKQREPVNINTADADEIAQKLLISQEVAEKIVEIRGKITRYQRIEELLLVELLTAEEILEIQDYVLFE